MPMFRRREIFTFQWLGPVLGSISWPLKLLGAIPKKNLLLFGNFPKGGGVISQSKLFEEIFLFCSRLAIFRKGGGWGGCLIPNFLSNFSALIWTLEDTARYAGLLLDPADGFGPGFFCPLSPFLAIFGVQ